jgi:hypothetical protein
MGPDHGQPQCSPRPSAARGLHRDADPTVSATADTDSHARGDSHAVQRDGVPDRNADATMRRGKLSYCDGDLCTRCQLRTDGDTVRPEQPGGGGVPDRHADASMRSGSVPDRYADASMRSGGVPDRYADASMRSGGVPDRYADTGGYADTDALSTRLLRRSLREGRLSDAPPYSAQFPRSLVELYALLPDTI